MGNHFQVVCIDFTVLYGAKRVSGPNFSFFSYSDQCEKRWVTPALQQKEKFRTNSILQKNNRKRLATGANDNFCYNKLKRSKTYWSRVVKFIRNIFGKG